MELPKIVRTNFQLPLVVGSLAIITAHLVLSAQFYMEGTLIERQAWATLAVLVLGVAMLDYQRLSPAVRGLVCTAVGIPAAMFGLGVHGSHIVQVGFATSDYTGILMAFAGLFLTAMGVTVLVRSVHTWWRRLLLIPPGMAFAFFIVFPASIGVFAANVAKVPCCHETPADYGFAYEDVTFETPGGLELSAWFVPSTNGATIITVHGAGKNRATVLPEATVLARHGYGLLMVDLEGFGNSEGRGNAFGWVGARDIHAAVAYLQSRPDVDPERIGGLGLSMGGEVLLQAAGESTGLAAIVAEGATGRTVQDFNEMDDPEYHYAGAPLQTVIGVTMQLISGESPPPPLKQMVQQIAPRHVLLIAASTPEEEELMAMYRDIGGPTFDLWQIPEPKHIGSYDLHPEEYEQRVIAFFDNALLGDLEVQPMGVR